MAFIGVLTIYSATAQNNVGVGTTNPDPSAVLEANSTTQGFLPPRMTEAQRNFIAAPVAAGLIVWCIDCGSNGETQVYNGTAWTNMVGNPAKIRPPVAGENFQGGIVIYVLQSGDEGYDPLVPHGLIAATVDQSTALGVPWGCAGTAVTGADGFLIGTGRQNTLDIIGNSCQIADGIESAAELCSTYSVVGADGITYADWYLPSKDEVIKMILAQGFLTGILINAYWCSTEVNNNDAYQRHVGNFGGQYSKAQSLGARAVRSY